MGDGRNSYSKTDLDATLMWMKDDHMKNGKTLDSTETGLDLEN